MPFQPISFANIEPQGNPFMRDLVDSLASGYKAGQLPAQLQRQRQEEELKNAFQSMLNQEQPEKFSSEMQTAAINRALNEATTNKMNTMTPLEARELALKNQFYPDLTKAQIQQALALAKMRQFGGSGVGVGGKEEFLFQNLVKRDNPGLTDDQAYEAANVLRMGGDTLSDGTKLNAMSPASQASFDRLTKYGTTSPLITQGVGSAQASAEYEPLNNKLKELNKTIGSTYAGSSPSAVMNSYLGGDVSDKQMAAIMARGQLASAAATLQNRIETGQSFATIINEILNRSSSDINANWAKVTPEARNMALDIVQDTMRQMYDARRNVPVGASKAFNLKNSGNSGNKGASNQNARVFNLATGKFE